MPKSDLYLACYDVSDDRERERVGGVLEGFGLRVQKSVFECRLTRSSRQKLLDEVDQLKVETGFLYLYKLDAKSKRHGAGVLPAEPFGEDRFSFVV